MIVRFALAAAVCGLWSTTTLAESRTFPVSSFDRVSVSAGISAIVEAGGDVAVTADAVNAAILERLRIEVRGNRLEIGYDTDFLGWIFNFGQNKGVVVHVSAPLIVGAEASSGADVDVRGMAGDVLTLASSSGASLSAKTVSGGRVSAESSSGARMTVDGTCEQLIAEASSGATVEAMRLTCDNVDAEASSGGHADVRASKSIDANASSGGSVQIYGKAADVHVNSSGGGSISFAN